jgi:hypothetical protein
MEVIERNPHVAADGTFEVAATGRSTTRGDVSAEWAKRPADQRFLSLDDLHATCLRHAENSEVHEIDTSKLQLLADQNEIVVRLASGKEFRPTNWLFDQLASVAKAPRNFLRELPAPIAALNLQVQLDRHGGPAAAYTWKNGGQSIRAITSQKYGRIFDHEVVASLIKLRDAGKGRWKVPGNLEWSKPRNNGGTFVYNPNVPVTLANTTIYGSDRDIFVFLVDDRNPIEIGKLPNGQPDLVFRGFYVRNSEVGASKYVLATMYLRGVCCNRILWGVEGFAEHEFRHTSGAPERFLQECTPALESYAEGKTGLLIDGVIAAKKMIVARKDEDRLDFLMSRKGGEFNKLQAAKLVNIHVEEEGKKPESIWDFSMAITAAARSGQWQDERVALEGKAKKMLDKVAA